MTLALGALWVCLLAGAVFMLWRGVRGEPTDNLPRCRRCLYNVGGRPNRPLRCPECGANLQRLGSIRLGARRPHRARITTGVALLLAALSPAGVLVWRAMPKAVPVVVKAVAPARLGGRAGRAARLARVRAAAQPRRLSEAAVAALLPAREVTLAAPTSGSIDPDALFDLFQQHATPFGMEFAPTERPVFDVGAFQAPTSPPGPEARTEADASPFSDRAGPSGERARFGMGSTGSTADTPVGFGGFGAEMSRSGAAALGTYRIAVGAGLLPDRLLSAPRLASGGIVVALPVGSGGSTRVGGALRAPGAGFGVAGALPAVYRQGGFNGSLFANPGSSHGGCLEADLRLTQPAVAPSVVHSCR